jgi:hypothetical protein
MKEADGGGQPQTKVVGKDQRLLYEHARDQPYGHDQLPVLYRPSSCPCKWSLTFATLTGHQLCPSTAASSETRPA